MEDINFSQGPLMKELGRIMQQLQEENNNFGSAFEQLQIVPNLITISTIPSVKEPGLSLPHRFDGTGTKFWNFINQVRLIFHMQPQKHSTVEFQVGLISTLLIGAALSGFSPLLEKNSTIFVDLDTFLTYFNNIFGNTNRVWSLDCNNKIVVASRKLLAASTYAAKFRLLANDVDCKGLISAFGWDLQDDVKDLLLNLPDFTSLSKAIIQAVGCDN